jgi:hypothetical protein
MGKEQAAEMIALLREIRDELQRPRLAREHIERQQRARDAEQVTRLATARAADAADAAERAKRALWAGGAGIPKVRTVGPPE